MLSAYALTMDELYLRKAEVLQLCGPGGALLLVAVSIEAC